MNTTWRKDTCRIVSPPLACPILFLTAQALPAVRGASSAAKSAPQLCSAFPQCRAPTLPSALLIMQEAMHCFVTIAADRPWPDRARDRPRCSTPRQQRVMPDVATTERAVEMDAIDCGVGAIARLRQIIAQCAHAQHAATGGDDIAVAV